MPDTPITWIRETRKLSELVPWEHNPKQLTEEQGQHLAKSIRKFGLVHALAISPDGLIYDGNSRDKLLLIMDEYGEDAEIDVRVSSRPLTREEHDELIIRLKENTGDYDWDILANHFEVEKLTEWGFPEWKLDEFMPEEYDPGVEDGAQPNPRNLPIDAIFTLSNWRDAYVPIALTSGWKWGVQSNKSIINDDPIYPIDFIDNDYFDYNHDVHLACVKKYRPKYATVMDAMTEKQCRKDTVSYHGLDRILDWAEELSEYAENVIVIPKYDCLDKIPEKYILGYSVPTSHGGTPLSVDLFRGRRVHLLGGSWKKQLSYMAALGDDVVSLDNNYVWLTSTKGSVTYKNGEVKRLNAIDARWDNLVNPAVGALALSLGAMGQKINELYGTNVQESKE